MQVPNRCSTFVFWYGIIIWAAIITCCACSSAQTDKTTNRHTMKLQWELIPEDIQQHFYTLSWKDTLGRAEDFSMTQRPLEVWCVITNQQQDTLGYYQGLSSPRTFVGFQSDDTIIHIHFAIGINFFSTEWQTKTQYKEYWERYKLPIRFEPLLVNLHQDLRRSVDKVLIESISNP